MLSRPTSWSFFGRRFKDLRARLRGDLDQMTDEALRRDNGGGTGNLSNVPLHMADLGTDNYDQEFTLGLIENEQGTLELVNEALGRMEKGTYGLCAECAEPISKPRLQAIPYAQALHSLCTEAGGWRMKDEGRVGLARWLLFWSIALGGTAFDLVTKSIIFSRVGPPASPADTDHPQDPRAAHQREYRRTLGLRRRPAGQQPDLRRAFGRRRGRRSSITCSFWGQPPAGC